jgi:hypothetical protein
MKKKIIFFILLLQPIILNADIIYLKNGKIFKGTIVRQTLTKVEIQLQNKQFISINKEEIKKIVYISDEELRKIQKQKEEEQKKRLEALKKEQEELQRKLEEEKRLQELQQRIEEQKRLEELQKQQEELERQKLEEEKRLQELQQKELEEEKQFIESPVEQKKHQFQYELGVGLGSFNIPLNQFYQYYNVFSSYVQNNQSLYNQNLKIQMKSLPTWNWAGNLHAGMSYHDKNLETGFLITGNIQKPNPKFISIPNKKIFDSISQPQYETYSENRYNQKKYLNLSNTIFFKFGTSEYLDFFWNYIFPYIEIGYFNRNLEFVSNSNATLITSIRNSFTDEFEIYNGYITDSSIKNQLTQNALSIGIPFRFLMIFSSEFLLEFHIFLLGKSQLNQKISEYNLNLDDSNLSNMIVFKSEFNGTFKGNKISFLWQNKYSSNGIVYMRISKTEYENTFKELKSYSVLLLPQTNFNLISPIVLFSNPTLKTIQENSFFLEFGIKYLNIF